MAALSLLTTNLIYAIDEVTVSANPWRMKYRKKATALDAVAFFVKFKNLSVCGGEEPALREPVG